MAGDLQEIYQLALNYFYRKFKDKGGTQSRLAAKLGVSQSYMSAVLNGRKEASMDLQERLANILYGPYEDFLIVGRRLQNGLEPELVIKSDRDEEVETLISRLSHYIRDYQRIEKKLVDKENFYKILLDKMPSGVIVTDQNDKIFFVNTWSVNKIGVPRESLIGSSVIEAKTTFPLVMLDELQFYYLKAKELMEQQTFTGIRIITPLGEEVYRSGWCIPVYDHGEYMGMIIIIGDITGEVRLRKKLQEEILIMKSAMESMDQVGWMILDGSKRIIKRNSIYQKMFNIPGEILQGDSYRKNLEWVKQFMVDQDEFMRLSFELPREGKKAIHEFELVDGRLIRRISSPLFDENQVLIGWNIILSEKGAGEAH